MAAKSFVKLRGFVFCGRLSVQRHNSLRHFQSCNTIGFHRYRVQCQRNLQYFPFSTTSRNSSDGNIPVKYENGLPIFYVPLPSRQDLCQFTLRPVSNTLGDLIQCLQEEDRGIDRVTAYNNEGTRIAKSTPIDILLLSDFQLVINDKSYQINPPKLATEVHDQIQELSDVKNSIAQLYSTLNVEQYQLEREKEITAKLEQLKTDIQPYESIMAELTSKSQNRTHVLSWVGLGFMGLQFGILARLTWWEYSWDIMEPVTYFVTYGTTMVMFGYYVLTKQEYNFADVKDREYLLTLHRLAKKKDFNIDQYNKLCESIYQAELDLKRLRDPLQMQLPLQQLNAQKKEPQ